MSKIVFFTVTDQHALSTVVMCTVIYTTNIKLINIGCYSVESWAIGEAIRAVVGKIKIFCCKSWI